MSFQRWPARQRRSGTNQFY